MTRVCAREGCGRSIDHLRADAIYCSPTCRQTVTRVGGAEALTGAAQARAFWRGYKTLRRPQRAPQASTRGAAA